LLDVRTTPVNAGKTRVTVEGGFTRIQQILPLDERMDRTVNPARFGEPKGDEDVQRALTANELGVLSWSTLCKHLWDKKFVLEPNENQEVNEQFLIPRRVKVVRVYSYLVSPEDNSMGYEKSAMFSIEKEGGSQNAVNAEGGKSDGYRLLCVVDREPPNQSRAKPAGAVGSK